MIRNLVFDMGGVLMEFCPEKFVARVTDDAADAQLLLREVFASVEWACLDRGTMDDAQALAAMNRRLPARLHPAAQMLVSHWNEPVLPVEGMAALLRELKAKGLGLYLLSNAARRQHEYWPCVPGSEQFDGTFISADWLLVKPQPEIYRALYACWGLQPQECFFIDDSPQNVEGARMTGMEGAVFHGDVRELRGVLSARGIL